MKLSAYVPGTQAWNQRRDAILCMRTYDRIQEIVDGEIGASRAERVLERHLEACRNCNAEAEVLRELKEAIARVGSQADPQLVERLEGLAHRLCQGHDAEPRE